MESTLHSLNRLDFCRTPIAASPTASTQVDSRDLLRGAREIVIRHGDQEYRLRHTQNDKLILTK